MAQHLRRTERSAGEGAHSDEFYPLYVLARAFEV
jgi:hypothetical protein